MLSTVISYLNEHVSVGWTLLVAGFAGWYRLNIKNLIAYRSDPDGLAQAQKHVHRHPTKLYADIYRRNLQMVLDWLDAHLGDQPWSGCAFDWCLRIAIAYPVISLVLVWGLTGDNTSGIFAMLPSNIGAFSRTLGLFWIGCLVLILLNIRKKGRQRTLLALCWIVVSFIIFSYQPPLFRIFDAIEDNSALNLSFTGEFVFALLFGIMGITVLTGAVIITIALVAVFAGTGAGAGAVAGSAVSAVAIAGGGAITQTIVLFLVKAGTSISSIIFAASTSIFLYVIVIVGTGVEVGRRVKSALEKILRQQKSHLRFLIFVGFLFPLILVILAVLSLGIVERVGGQEFRLIPSLLVFVAVLPLVNVLFDWGSLGLTRHLLRRSLNAAKVRAALCLGAIDALAAFAILAGLAVAVPTALTGLNALAAAGGWSEPLIDVAGPLDRLRTSPGDLSISWIYLMLFSTLLPSFVHIAIAGAALVTVGWPDQWNRWYACNLTEGRIAHGPTRYWLAGYLTFRQLTEFGLPIAVLTVVAASLIFYGILVPWVAQWLLMLADIIVAAS